jgi:hypothetical protein
VSGQLHVLTALSPGKEPSGPTRQEVGWSPKLSWMTWRSENSESYQNSNSDLLVVQSVASHYNDCTTATLCKLEDSAENTMALNVRHTILMGIQYQQDILQ